MPPVQLGGDEESHPAWWPLGVAGDSTGS